MMERKTKVWQEMCFQYNNCKRATNYTTKLMPDGIYFRGELIWQPVEEYWK